jgi:two-component system, NarL family, sensor histidine kinase DesK
MRTVKRVSPGESTSNTMMGRPLRARLSMAVWLAFIAFPLVAAYTDPREDFLHKTVVSIVVAAFCAVYIGYCALPDPARGDMDRRFLFAVVIILAAAISFLVIYDRAVWDYSYVYCLWPAIALTGYKPWAVPLVAGLVVAVGAAAGLDRGSLFTVTVIVIGVGATIYGVTRLVVANETLRRAHADQATAAVAEERIRFARDLHELLSHSLSVIALKSQVASRLAADQPARAATEMAEIEQITRQALQEVRDAVSGYRRASLLGELEGARRALTAAGIALQESVGTPHLPETVEAPLAWALREAITNVVRHSHASTCTASLVVDGRTAVLTVADDGTGPAEAAASPAPAGNGLRGLAERVGAVGGALDAGVGQAGGFALSVSVPLSAEAEACPTLFSPPLAGTDS